MRKTLYEAVGGAEPFHRLCDEFYTRVFADPLLIPLFHDPNENHAGRLALWLIEVFGGPKQYTNVRGGFAVMVASHHGLRITDEQRARWVEHMTAACAAVALPQEARIPLLEYVNNGAFWAQLDSHR